MKRIWLRLRESFRENGFLRSVLASAILAYFRLVYRTNPFVRDDRDVIGQRIDAGEILIFMTWHGQHFMIPVIRYKGEPSATMVSKSRDAELNALVLEKAGMHVARGSGGRDRLRANEKGGARALIAMRQQIEQGRCPGFIADVPKGTPREASMGSVTLARMTGCRIQPVAYATSRHKVFERSWDKAVLNLPFGRAALVAAEPISVAPDADENAMEEARLLLQTRLNAITQTAYAAADRQAGTHANGKNA